MRIEDIEVKSGDIWIYETSKEVGYVNVIATCSKYALVSLSGKIRIGTIFGVQTIIDIYRARKTPNAVAHREAACGRSGGAEC